MQKIGVDMFFGSIVGSDYSGCSTWHVVINRYHPRASKKLLPCTGLPAYFLSVDSTVLGLSCPTASSLNSTSKCVYTSSCATQTTRAGIAFVKRNETCNLEQVTRDDEEHLLIRLDKLLLV